MNNILSKPVLNKLFKLYGIFIFIFSLSDYFLNSIPHMTTANILPGISPHLGIGLPYSDYWDVYPPGIYMFYYLAYFFTYDNFYLYNVLHVFILFYTCFFSYKIFLKLKAPIFIYYISLTYFLSPLYMNYLLPNDLLALFFSSWGLYIFLYSNDEKIKLILSNFLLVFAFFIKETLFLSSLTILLIGILTKNLKIIQFTLLGYLISFLFVATYSETLSITQLVIESYVIKFEVFSFTGTIVNGLFLLLTLFAFLLLLQSKRFIILKNFLNQVLYKEQSSIYIYSLLMLLTYALVDKDDGGHFDIPKIFALFFILCFLYKLKINRLLVLVLIIGLSSYTLKLNHSLYSYTQIQPNFTYSEVSTIKDISQETKTLLKNSNDDFLFLYGWGSTNAFYELKTKPYSKYWLVHPQILTEKQIFELKKQLEKNLPEYIYYCGFALECPSGFDFKLFESEYINFSELITKCYIEIDNKIFKLDSKTCNYEFKF